jgi:hypothetical protein
MIRLCCLMLISVLCFFCKKESKNISANGNETCLKNSAIPVGPFTPVNTDYNKNHCGYLPLGKKNYWVYVDSVFNATGFQYAKIDTVRFDVTSITSDSTIWWSQSTPTSVMYPRYLYSMDSTTYVLAGAWGYNATKWFYSIPLDSTNEDCRSTDVSSFCIAKKMTSPVIVPAGSFTNCMYYEKLGFHGNGINSAIWFKPGIGGLRSVTYLGSTWGILTGQLLRTSTLIGYFIEQ